MDNQSFQIQGWLPGIPKLETDRGLAQGGATGASWIDGNPIESSPPFFYKILLLGSASPPASSGKHPTSILQECSCGCWWTEFGENTDLLAQALRAELKEQTTGAYWRVRPQSNIIYIQ